RRETRIRARRTDRRERELELAVQRPPALVIRRLADPGDDCVSRAPFALHRDESYSAVLHEQSALLAVIRMTAARISTQCCIAGGGPAGMMLGLLLARAGVNVLVLEKHADFLRDFRGDTIHPSTLEVMHELGLLDEFLKRPHQEVHELGAWIGQEFVMLADFAHLPTQCKFVALMPQWDFLDFLATHSRRYPTFQWKMQAEVVGLREEGGRVVGVRATTP